jgi:hypothetical protein
MLVYKCMNFIYHILNLFLSNFLPLIIAIASIVEILAAVILGCIIFERRWVIGTFMNYIVKKLLVIINRTHFDSCANKICNIYNILQYSIIFYNKYMNLYRNKFTSHIIFYNFLLFPTIFHLLLQYSILFYTIL